MCALGGEYEVFRRNNAYLWKTSFSMAFHIHILLSQPGLWTLIYTHSYSNVTDKSNQSWKFYAKYKQENVKGYLINFVS